MAILPVLRHETGNVACPRNLGSPNTSSSCTMNLISAKSGQVMSKVLEQFSLQVGFKPLSSEKNRIELYSLFFINISHTIHFLRLKYYDLSM